MLLVKGPLNNTEEWKAARVGMVTASNFAKVMTGLATDPKQFGETALAYALIVGHERVTKTPHPSFSNKDTDWGHQYESFAIEEYQDRYFRDVEPGCFVHKPGTIIGGSPDGFVGDDGLVEVKCPASGSVHLATFLDDEMPLHHRWQVQGLLWITGRQWCDFISFDPRYPDKSRMVVKTIHRNEKTITALSMRLIPFINIVKDYERRAA